MRYDCLSRVRRRVRPNKRIYRRRQNIIFGAPTSLFFDGALPGGGRGRALKRSRFDTPTTQVSEALLTRGKAGAPARGLGKGDHACHGIEIVI